ncbi:hypothetical protein ACXIHB_01595 [Tenacibaculum sp. IMCC1]
MTNKKQYSLLFVQTVERLNNRVRQFVEKNSDILELTTDDPMELLIKDKSKISDFQFLIHSPNQDNRNKILFKADYNPANNIAIGTKKTVAEEKSILVILEQWTNIIRSYNKASWTPEENILNEYEREFYENFEILDEDADKNPYKLEKQIIIHNYFVKVIKVLKDNEEDNAELIKEAEEIKDNIPKMTKKATVKKISKFFANVRKKSLPLLKEVLELGRKEVFKRGIKFVLDNIGDWIALTG